MLFKSAYLQLTLWYVAIIMAISLVFSGWVYQEATKELRTGLERQGVVFREPVFGLVPTVERLQAIREDQLAQARGRIFNNLVYLNVFVLGAGGAASYWLAKRTMRPIKAALESQKRFTADASHELRTPLAVMRAEIEVSLRDKGLKLHEAKDLLASNLEEVQKLEILSTALLRLAQYQENGSALTMRQIELQPLLEKTTRKAKKLAAKRSIALVARFDPVSVRADSTSLQELVMILLDNAIKYSPDGSEISIRTVVDSEHADIVVRDNGLGIEPDAMPYVFDRFYRADSSRQKARAGGFGLGLSIAKAIAEAHSGVITVASKPGRGSTFTLRLPLDHK